jgi:hypothetical protein
MRGAALCSPQSLTYPDELRGPETGRFAQQISESPEFDTARSLVPA